SDLVSRGTEGEHTPLSASCHTRALASPRHATAAPGRRARARGARRSDARHPRRGGGRGARPRSPRGARSHRLGGRPGARSRRARAAGALWGMATLRRDGGDASEMDVRLARIIAGQLVNQAADDSLGALAALLVLQQVMGLPGDTGRLVLADTLAPPPPDGVA